MIKYSLEEFKDNTERNLCLYIGGGLKGSETICKESRKQKSSYCEEHHKLCFVPPPKKELKE